MLLSHRGFKVSIFDKNEDVGGRNRPLRLGAYTFDIGPTFLLMKGVLDEMFALCDRRSDAYLELTELNPMYRLLFDDRELLVYSDRERMRAELNRAFSEGCAGYDAFLRQEGDRFRHLYPCITRDYSSLGSFFSLDLLRALPKLAITKSVFANLGRYFRGEKMRLAFSFQSKYLGMSPWDCPALFTMLPYVEHQYGIYHVIGGLNRISAAMARVIGEQGGTIHTGTPIESLLVAGKTVKGVRLSGGEEIHADETIVNADFAHAMSTLVPHGMLRKYNSEQLEKHEYSCSTFMLYLGLKKRYEIPHHNIVFARDYHTNMRNTFHFKTLSRDFSFYVQNAAVTDPSLAPAGRSGLYMLIPVPNNLGNIDWNYHCAALREQALGALATRMCL